MRGSLFALFGVAIVLGAAVGPAVAAAGSAGNDDATDGAANAPLSVSIGQTEGVAVTVTANGTAVENATVTVDTVDANASYAGTGTYATDANGTVGLPTPAETVAVSVTATKDGRSDSTTALLQAENASFGQQVSAMVELLKAVTSGGIGADLAAWVVAHNPGNAPDHAGPPDHAGGPPDHAGPGADDANEVGGPPEHAGGNNGGGPPAHAGPGDGDGGDEDTESPTPTPTESDDQ